MKFTKLAKSEKFEYMMLSRLIQDAKYFIEHPDLKHLWARTLDEHIKQMKEQYTKLDPKPEWTSEEEINNLAKQMKESYTNHWNEVHPDNKIEANNYYKINDNFKVSDNFKVGDKVFFDTLYEFQEDDLGFNYDRGILKEIKHWPSNNREYYIIQTDDGKLLQVGYVFHTEEDMEAFRNNWMNPKFEKESAITQPNKPKPTTMLPDNMEWAWDPDAADWVAVLKDNANTTPPLYDPNNQNVVNQTTNYMSTVKSSSNLIDVTIKFDNGDIIETNVNGDRTDEQIKEYYKVGKTFNLGSGENDNLAKVVDVIIDRSMQKQSSCLAKFLDGPQYSKEIKIEAGLIKDGLIKYAGFDFNRGTKYTITTKGLEVLRKASEQEHNEALNEREKLAYLFGFNTDEVSTLDTTGKTIKSDKKLNTKSLVNKLYNEIKKNKNNWEDVDDLSQYTYIDTKEEDNGIMVYVRTELSYDEMMKLAEILNKVVQKFDSLSYFEPLQPGIMQAYIENKKSASLNKYAKKYTICEADGTELGELEADSELDAKVKFGIEHPEYAESLSICAKEVKSYYKDHDYLKEIKDDYYNGKLSLGDAAAMLYEYGYYNYIPSEERTKKDLGLLKDAKYEETTETHEPYPNPSETPNDHIILENHDGWVNTASFEDDIRKQFQQPHQKLPNSDRDLELLEKEILDLIEGDKKEQVKSLFDQFQFSDKEAAQVTPEFAKLHELLGEYKKQDLITLTDLDGNLVASGDPQVINELEHKVKDIGYYCESVSEISDSDYAETYSLKIFMK